MSAATVVGTRSLDLLHHPTDRVACLTLEKAILAKLPEPLFATGSLWQPASRERCCAGGASARWYTALLESVDLITWRTLNALSLLNLQTLLQILHAHDPNLHDARYDHDQKQPVRTMALVQSLLQHPLQSLLH